jgi:rubrerythrin
MSQEHPEGSGYRILQQQTTLKAVLETASEFEKTAYEFYQSLQSRVSKRLRPLVEELVEEEQRHYALFQELSQRPDVQARIRETIQRPASDHRFSDYVQLPELADFPDDQAILQYAMGREQAAMEQYGALAEETRNGPLHDAFRFLAQEELEHKKELEKRYFELVHSGGV